MAYRLKTAILAAACVWGVVWGPDVRAQDKSEYFSLMQEADRLLMASKLDEARSRYAQALQRGAEDAEKTRAALLLAMTFETEGTFQEAECRAWAADRFDANEDRQSVERGIREYRRKFLGDFLEEDDAAYFLRPLMATSQSEDLDEKIRSVDYAQLIRRGEEANLQGRQADARQFFAAALASESKKEALSRAAKGIVLSFESKEGLDAKGCMKWSEANVPVAEDQLRVALAVGEFHYRKQDYDKAVAQLENVVKRKGAIAENGSLVLALSLLAQEKREEGLTTLRQVAEESSSEEIAAKAIFLIGWAHLQAQEYAAAKTAFDELARQHPGSPFAEKAVALSKRLESYVE